MRLVSGGKKIVVTLEVDREQAIETAMMEKAIALYQKSLEESAAQADAEIARAKAAEAEERVQTVRESEIAKRSKDGRRRVGGEGGRRRTDCGPCRAGARCRRS